MWKIWLVTVAWDTDKQNRPLNLIVSSQNNFSLALGTSVNFLFPLVRESRIFSRKWKKGIIVKVPKEGTALEYDNWEESICVLLAGTMIITEIILHKGAQGANSFPLVILLHRSQHLTDQFETICGVSILASPHFIDFEKVFDSASRSVFGVLYAGGALEHQRDQ